jgi:hypothetical protein
VRALAAGHDAGRGPSEAETQSTATQREAAVANLTEKPPSCTLASTPPGTNTRRASTFGEPVAWQGAAPVEAGAVARPSPRPVPLVAHPNEPSAATVNNPNLMFMTEAPLILRSGVDSPRSRCDRTLSKAEAIDMETGIAR